MNGIAVATQNCDLDIVISKFLLPCAHFASVGKQIIDRAMMIIGISTGSDLGRFDAHALIFLDQLIEREVGKRGVEHTDWNLSPGSGVRRRSFSLRRSSRERGGCSHGSSDDAACGSQKRSARRRERI